MTDRAPTEEGLREPQVWVKYEARINGRGVLDAAVVFSFEDGGEPFYEMPRHVFAEHYMTYSKAIRNAALAAYRLGKSEAVQPSGFSGRYWGESYGGTEGESDERRGE